ncbi:hypothetical protein SH528x_003200 [Novipirellula sp. SH528]|uniref:hypothetical protein n=1 Tax=Novipirellula sp. SH528 TaxID=3454466 RepID=UPI003F9F4F66
MTVRSCLTSAAIAAFLFAAGCDGKTTTERVNPLLQYEVYAIATAQGPATKTVFDIDTSKNVLVHVPPVFTHADIAAFEVTKCDHDQSRVVVVPTAAGLARLKATAARGKIGVVLNGVGLQRQFRFQTDDSGRFNLSGHPNGLFHDSALPKVVDLK